MQTNTIKYFAFAHLPAHLQAVSKPIGEVANLFEQQLPEGAEKSAGMRKLLEAKDCFVRAALDAPKPTATSTLQPHQQRVVDEKRDLDERATKLDAFFATPIFTGLDTSEQGRLREQLGYMRNYSDILGERIAAFAKRVTFDQFVQHGRDSGGNIVGGMPWSFKFHGHPVSHENDQCYLIGHNAEQLRFTPGDVLVVGPDGGLSVEAKALPA